MRAALLLALLFGAASVDASDLLVWDFAIDESQVRNGPELDGSTNSPGHGHGRVVFDPDRRELQVRIEFEALVGELTKLHVHGPALAARSTQRHVIEFLGPPPVPPGLRATRGVFEARIPLEATRQKDFPALPPERVLELLTSGRSYLNVHTDVFGKGEIRGNLGTPEIRSRKNEAAEETHVSPPD